MHAQTGSTAAEYVTTIGQILGDCESRGNPATDTPQLLKDVSNTMTDRFVNLDCFHTRQKAIVQNNLIVTGLPPIFPSVIQTLPYDDRVCAPKRP